MHASVTHTADFTKLPKTLAESNQDDGAILLLARTGGQGLAAFCVPWKGQRMRLQEVLCHNPATPGDVLETLRRADGPGVGRCERRLHHVSLSFFWMCHGIEEHCLVVWKSYDEGVTLVGYKGGILPVHHSAALVAVFGYDNLHAMVWKYIWACSHGNTGTPALGVLGQRTACPPPCCLPSALLPSRRS